MLLNRPHCKFSDWWEDHPANWECDKIPISNDTFLSYNVTGQIGNFVNQGISTGYGGEGSRSDVPAQTGGAGQ